MAYNPTNPTYDHTATWSPHDPIAFAKQQAAQYKDFAGMSGTAGTALGGAQQAPSDPGITSAIQGLEMVVRTLLDDASDLENILGLSPALNQSPDKDLDVPPFVVRLQKLANSIDSANYKIHKSLNHLRS